MISAQLASLAQTPNPIKLEKSPPPNVYLLYHAFEMIYQLKGISVLPLDELEERRFDEAISLVKFETFRRIIKAYLEHLNKYSPKRGKLLLNLLEVFNPHVQNAKALKNPITTPFDLSSQKTNRQDSPGREISRQPIPDHRPKPTLPALQTKKPHLRPAQTVRQFILEFAPYPDTIRLFDTVFSHCWNRQSRRGKKAYPYGQAYAARLMGWSGRKLRRRWQWLKKVGVFNKAVNENPNLHHNSLWYVCSSMKAVAYFRDPQKRRRRS